MASPDKPRHIHRPKDGMEGRMEREQRDDAKARLIAGLLQGHP